MKKVQLLRMTKKISGYRNLLNIPKIFNQLFITLTNKTRGISFNSGRIFRMVGTEIISLFFPCVLPTIGAKFLGYKENDVGLKLIDNFAKT